MRASVADINDHIVITWPGQRHLTAPAAGALGSGLAGRLAHFPAGGAAGPHDGSRIHGERSRGIPLSLRAFPATLNEPWLPTGGGKAKTTDAAWERAVWR